MTAPTFTCDRCGKGTRLRLNVAYHMICKPCFEAVCRDIDQFAGEGGSSPDFEGERGSDSEASTPHPPSPVPDSYLTAMRKDLGTQPASPSLVERARRWTDSGTWIQVERRDLVREMADRIEELEAEMATMHRSVVHECCERVQELEADNADLRRAIELAEDPEFVLRHRELEKLIEAGEVSIGISADEFRQRYIGKDRPADLASDDRLLWNGEPNPHIKEELHND